MKIIQLFLNNSLRNFNYILYSEKTQEAIVFDPYEVALIDKACAEYGLTAKYLINTHSHPDHVRGNDKFLKQPRKYLLKLSPEESFNLSDTEKIVCKSTPGHVKEHYCYYLYNKNELFGVITGDTVFNAGVGNCRDGGDPKILYRSIRDYFISLKDNVLIYPSHDYFLTNLNFAKTIDKTNFQIDKYIDMVKEKSSKTEFLITNIGEEKQYNPFFRIFSDSNFCDEFLKKNNLNSQEEAFVKMRGQRDRW